MDLNPSNKKNAAKKSTLTRTPPEPTLAQLDLVAVLQALADPVRLRIVRAIFVAGEQPCKACSCPQMAKSTVAHHFKVLRQAGVITSRAVGTELRNAVRSADLEARFPGLIKAVVNAETTASG